MKEVRRLEGFEAIDAAAIFAIGVGSEVPANSLEFFKERMSDPIGINCTKKITKKDIPDKKIKCILIEYAAGRLKNTNIKYNSIYTTMLWRVHEGTVYHRIDINDTDYIVFCFINKNLEIRRIQDNKVYQNLSIYVHNAPLNRYPYSFMLSSNKSGTLHLKDYVRGRNKSRSMVEFRSNLSSWHWQLL